MRRFGVITGPLLAFALASTAGADEPLFDLPAIVIEKRPAPPAGINDRPLLPPPVDPPAPPARSEQPLQPELELHRLPEPTPPAKPEQPVQTEQPAPSCDPGGVDWRKIPPARTAVPRLGWFQIPRDGCGYYSVLDLLRDRARENPPKTPYPPQSGFAGSFFDADYRYLDDPENTSTPADS